MCTRGIYQLKKLNLFFCDFGGFPIIIKFLINFKGSSKGVRDFMKSIEFKEFINNNQQIEFEYFNRRGRHPYISSSYINGYIKDQTLRNMSPEEILEKFFSMRNSCIFSYFF